jgi:uncharacterized protein (DUF1330 family)
MSLYALNLFDLAPNDEYRAYARESVGATARHGGHVVAMGRLAGTVGGGGDTGARHVMILVEWPSRAAFDAFLDDPALADLHERRAGGTAGYLWWLYDRLEDLGPLFPALTEEVERTLAAASDGAVAERPRGRLQGLLAERSRRQEGSA